MINLILALAWLVFGGVMLAWAALDPERNARLPGLNMHFLGGGALALAFYNFARWWLLRRPREIDWMGREFPPRKPPRVVDYNPDLDFSEQPERERADDPADRA